jgi:glycine hydroxymethyltransferase
MPAQALDSVAGFATATYPELDPVVASLLGRELKRQRGKIDLVASENYAWPGLLHALGSILANKLGDGYPGSRFSGCDIVDEIENLAVERAKSLFGAEHANVQPLSGAAANLAVFLACLAPGETLLAMRPEDGGHLTHGLEGHISAQLYNCVHYGVDPDSGLVDPDEVRRVAQAHAPKLIVCGGSAYPRAVDVVSFREIADEVGALLLCDMAHFAGLVAASLHPDPIPHADFVTSTIHKTLSGPRSGGFILCRSAHADAVDRAVTPGLQAAPLSQTIAVKATCFELAATEAFRAYQGQIRANADVLARTLLEEGLDLVAGGTDTHLVLVDLRRTAWSGRAAEERLYAANVTTMAYLVPGEADPQADASGLRLGTPAVTMRGFDENDMDETARLITKVLERDADVPGLAARAADLCRRRPLYQGLDPFLR